MFRGKGPGDARRQAEFKKYPKGIHVTFNKSAYTSGITLNNEPVKNTSGDLHTRRLITNLDFLLSMLSSI